MNVLELLEGYKERLIISEEGVAKFNEIAEDKGIVFSVEVESGGKEVLKAGPFYVIDEVFNWTRKIQHCYWEYKPTFYLKAWISKDKETMHGCAIAQFRANDLTLEKLKEDGSIISALDEAEIELRNQGLCTALIYSIEDSGETIKVDIVGQSKPVIHCQFSFPALVELAVDERLTLRQVLLMLFRKELVGD